jgi:predicted nuclease with RNAse H fold
MSSLRPVTIIDQLPTDLTKEQFLARCQPRMIKYGMRVLLPTIEGVGITFRAIPLTRTLFSCGRDAFIGYDAIDEQWYCRL